LLKRLNKTSGRINQEREANHGREPLQDLEDEDFGSKELDFSDCIYLSMDEGGCDICMRGECEEECLGADCEHITPERRCRICGCTDCSPCIEKTGEPCYWVEADLCSACVEEAYGKGTEAAK
jgi:hypothetical protein